MRRNRLPDSLGDVFTTAEAMDAGVTRSRLRASDLVAGHRGLHVRADATAPLTPADHRYERLRKQLVHRARTYAHIMPANQFFMNVVAGAVWELPIPTVLLEDAKRSLDVGVLSPHRHPRRSGIIGHQMQPHLVTVTDVDGLRVTDAVSTWATMASILGAHDELVVLGDAVVRERIFRSDRDQLATIDELRAAAAARRSGAHRLRKAAELVRTRSASAGETRCRLALVGAGLREPRLNVAVYDGLRNLVAVVDLAYEDLKIAVEYEGGQHLTDADQWARDITRHEALVAMGWIVIRVTKEQLYDGPETVISRVRAAIAARTAG